MIEERGETPVANEQFDWYVVVLTLGERTQLVGYARIALVGYGPCDVGGGRSNDRLRTSLGLVLLAPHDLLCA